MHLRDEAEFIVSTRDCDYNYNPKAVKAWELGLQLVQEIADAHGNWETIPQSTRHETSILQGDIAGQAVK